MALTESVCRVVNLLDTQPAQLTPQAVDAGWEIQFDATPGLFQLSVIVDAARFDWESLYFNLTLFNNNGERTGPWDFDFRNKNAPLVPSYRVYVDGKYIGLWFFQRVSMEDIQAKRFRGRMAFWLRNPGKHTLRLVPFREMNIQWLSATLEADPEDSLQPLPGSTRDACEASPHSRWRDPAYWKSVKEKLAGPAKLLQPNFEAAIAELAKESASGVYIPLCIVGYRYSGNKPLLEKALAAVDGLLKQEAYGNPNPDGYSHNGDFGAAASLYNLALTLHAIPEELGPERVQKIKDKLRHHCQLFLDLMLLNRDYWGGSVIQDHGWKSTFLIGGTILNLRGVLPEADAWLTYTEPRAKRCLDAMPRDGFLPAGSYNSTWQHSDPLALYREMQLAIVGVDLCDRPEVQACADALFKEIAIIDNRPLLPGTLGDGLPLYAGGRLYAQLAQRHRCGKAQWVAIKSYTTTLDHAYHPNVKVGALENHVLMPLAYDPTVPPAKDEDRPERALHHFVDSAVAVARDDKQGVLFTVQAGPWSGFNAYRLAQGPCDRMAMTPSPGDGHFSLMIGGRHLLASPDGGYKLQTRTRTCMLVDGKGQFGDIGYPMSIPSFVYRGQEIQSTDYDPKSGLGHVRLNLAPSYTDDAGVVVYTRHFLFSPRQLVVRDRVVFQTPRTPTWLFQSVESLGLVWSGSTFRIADTLSITPLSTLTFKTQTNPTPVVFSYASASKFAKFAYGSYESAQPVREASVDFVLRW